MSRLMADQESRGGDGDPGAGEEDSVMRVNLAEGCGAVNDEGRRAFKRFVWSVWSIWFLSFFEPNKPNKPDNQTNRDRSGRELCSWDAFLYKNACAGH
jgi:hypothetical protein